MHCGCPLPGETIGQRLSAKIKRNSRVVEPSPLLPPSNPNILQATHPSDHNSVYAFHHEGESAASREQRRGKAEKRRQRDAEKARKGKLNSEAYARGDGHDAAFLTPIPLYCTPNYGACTAYYGGVDGNVIVGGCAAGVPGSYSSKRSCLIVCFVS